MRALAVATKHLVADGVAVGVVEELELVDVHHEQREIRPGALRPHDLLLEALGDRAAVGKAGEGVVVGEEAGVIIAADAIEGDAELGDDVLDELRFSPARARSADRPTPRHAAPSIIWR